MSRLEIKPLELKKFNTAFAVGDTTGEEGFAETITTADGGKFLLWDKDYKYAIVVSNPSSSTDGAIEFVENNSIYSSGTVSLPVAKSSTQVIQIESANFKRINEAEDKNYVYINALDTALKVAVYRLV